MSEEINAKTKRLAQVQKKKEMYFSRMQALYDLSLKAHTTEDKVFRSKARLMQTHRQEFEKCIDTINQLSSELNEKFVPSYKEMDAFDELYYAANDTYMMLEERRVAAREKGAQTVNAGGNTSQRLQPISLPIFSGAPEEWPIFYELFKKLVDDNSAYSPIEKVTHLITHLGGSAKLICSSISPTAENYPLILKALVGRFEDKRALGSTYLDKIINFKPLQAESESGLNQFLSSFVEPVKALKQLEISDLADFLFLHLALNRLDSVTSRAFEDSNRSSKEIPKFDSLVTFLSEQVKILGRSNFSKNPSVSSGKTQSQASKASPSGKNSQQINYSLLTQEPRSSVVVPQPAHPQRAIGGGGGCVLCNNGTVHFLYHCPEFKRMKVEDKWSFVKSKKLCFNCLSNLHMVSACQSTKGCQIKDCQKRHHSSLHRTFESQTQSPDNQIVTQTQSYCSTNSSSAPNVPSTVLLATVSVLAKDSQGNTHEIRGILDGGSQSNFLTHKVCSKLGLPMEPIRTMVKGIGSSPLNVSASTVLDFHSRVDPSHHYVAHALVVDRLSDRIPSSPVSVTHLPHLKNLPMADVNFHKPHEVDLLIGAELWPLIVGTRKIFGPRDTPVALETTLGFVVMGRSAINIQPQFDPMCLFAQSSVDELVQKFWELEEVPKRRLMSADDTRCEQLFMDSHVRNIDGTFTVHLPFRTPPDVLGSSKEICVSKFLSLERRLLRNTPMHNLYAGMLAEYLQDGTVSRVGLVSEVSDEISYYLPHHGVHRPGHPTTPLRIVFNASAPTSSSYSLNDILFVGPKLHAEIFVVLIRFRLFRFVLTADAKRMFLRIKVAAAHRKFQRFIWRSDPSQPLQVFEINTVVFGNTSSPYLANRVVERLAELEKDNYPLAAAVAKRDRFVDDIATSTDTEEEILELYVQLTAMFASGGFELSKWNSNSPKLLGKIPQDSCLSSSVDFDRDSTSKVLGVNWVPQEDNFSCVVEISESLNTKRAISSLTMSIFDPLGLVAPVTLIAKLILRELWRQNIGWDEEPPQEILTQWITFKNALPQLSQITVDRHVGLVKNAHTSLIGFADSSTKAYGACVYVRTVVGKELPVVRLLCAKSKVAPKQVVTIPRLELCAALLLSQLMRTVLDSFEPRHTFDSVVAFSDSRVTLHWIHSDPSRWKIFVGNRIAQVHENLAPRYWRHVSGAENPADVLSRGILPDGLLHHPLWFKGPSWLIKDETHWPAAENSPSLDVPEEEVKITSFLALAPPKNFLEPILDRVSSFRKLLRVTAYVFRACTRSNLRTPFIHRGELQKALKFWIRHVQELHYGDDISRLRKDTFLTSNIRNLDPFLHDGLLRVGGRLHNAPNLTFDQKHPILLPTKGRLVELLIDQYHIDLLHAGQQLILSSLRQKYWIPCAITRIRSRIHRCNICFRNRPKVTIPKMAPLPEARVDGCRPFARTGVDYAGPFSVTPQRRRGQKILTKAYVCLFVCLTVKAVHIELASDLSTECFLAAYKRFLSRRGPCSLLLSDGGTNFIGARRHLTELEELTNSTSFSSRIGDTLASKGVEWKINPAYGPWFGGLWESNIKSFKSHLHRFIGEQILTYEELNTVLVQIEAVMNSRPLCVQTNDPDSPTALTPAHFLTPGASLDHLPAQNLQGVQLNRLSRYQMIDRIVQDFWERWRREYLHTLQSRAKWTKDTTPIQTGTVVVLAQDNVPPLRWPLGIVEQVHPGTDGGVRVVSVRTRSGTYRRPVGKVCALPTQ